MATTWSDTYRTQRPRAVELYGQAKELIAGGVGHDVRHNPVAPMYIEYARGSRKWDVDGNEYIDYGMGNGALISAMPTQPPFRPFRVWWSTASTSATTIPRCWSGPASSRR